LVLPLTAEGRLDVEGWEVFPELCTITHTSGQSVTRTGRLTRNADCEWVFDFLEDGVDQPQIADRLADARFAAGQTISVTCGDGGHRLRIVSLRPF
jgi:hypothetical protein